MARPVGPICCKCGREMRPEENGVVAVLYAHQPPVPYEAYRADKWRCPSCGTEVLSGYSQEAIAVHFEVTEMAQVLAIADRRGNRYNVYERGPALHTYTPGAE